MSSKGAEIARRYWERRDADPDRRRKYLEKERHKWNKDRATGKKKGINELSEREKRAKRKKWREEKVKPEPETGPVLCYSQRHHPTPRSS